MFESAESNQIKKLESQALNLLQEIQKNNPKFLIKKYIEAKRDYNRGIKNNKLTRAVKQNYLNELTKIAELTHLDENDILSMSNKALLEFLEEQFSDYPLIDKKAEYRDLRGKIEILKEKEKKNVTVGKNKRLNADARNVLEFYIKKIPVVSVIDAQIKILNEELNRYKAADLHEHSKKTEAVIKILQKRRKGISTAFKDKTQIDADTYNERKKILQEDEEYKELLRKRNKVSRKLKGKTGSMLVLKFKRMRKIMDNIVLDFSENSQTIEIEQKWENLIQEILEITGLTKEELFRTKYSTLKKLIDENNNLDVERLRLDELNEKINQKKDEVLGVKTTESILKEIFDYENDETGGKIPKEILISANISKAQNIVRYTCRKFNQEHNFDDALSGGLMGLTVAANTWYEKQRANKSVIRFTNFMYPYVAKAAERALWEIQGGGRASGSVIADAMTKDKRRREDIEQIVANFIKDNPSMADLQQDLIKNLVEQEELELKINKIKPIVNETTMNTIISGGQDDVDMWSINAHNEKQKTYSPDEIIDGKKHYVTLLESIKKLMDLFEVRRIDLPNGDYKYQTTKKKLMDEYDKKIFLMYTGIEHKKTMSEFKNSAYAKTVNKYTLEEIAQEIVRMKKRNGVSNPTMATTSVTSRWKNIVKKLKRALDNDPDLRKGLEYLLEYFDNNKDLLNKFSNDREELSIKKDRDLIKGKFIDNEDIMNIEMIDGTHLSDNFELEDDNFLSDMELN